jgi:hypothetical protein
VPGKTYAPNMIYRWTRLNRIVGEKLRVEAIISRIPIRHMRRLCDEHSKSIHCTAWVDLRLPAHRRGRLFLAWSRPSDRCTDLLLNSETQLVDRSRMFIFLKRFNELLRVAREEKISPLMLTRWVLNSPRFGCPRYGYYGYETLAHIGPIAQTYPQLCDYRLAHLSRLERRSYTNGAVVAISHLLVERVVVPEVVLQLVVIDTGTDEERGLLLIDQTSHLGCLVGEDDG